MTNENTEASNRGATIFFIILMGLNVLVLIAIAFFFLYKISEADKKLSNDLTNIEEEGYKVIATMKDQEEKIDKMNIAYPKKLKIKAELERDIRNGELTLNGIKINNATKQQKKEDYQAEVKYLLITIFSIDSVANSYYNRPIPKSDGKKLAELNRIIDETDKLKSENDKNSSNRFSLKIDHIMTYRENQRDTITKPQRVRCIKIFVNASCVGSGKQVYIQVRASNGVSIYDAASAKKNSSSLNYYPADIVKQDGNNTLIYKIPDNVHLREDNLHFEIFREDENTLLDSKDYKIPIIIQ